MSLAGLWGSIYYTEYRGGAEWWKRTHCLLVRLTKTLRKDRRCSVSPALVQWLYRDNKSDARGRRKSTPEARDVWFKSHSRGWGQHQGHCSDASLFHSSVSSLALSQLPSETQRMECHEAKLLSASICSIRQTLPGFIKFLPIPFTFQQSGSTVEISLWLC